MLIQAEKTLSNQLEKVPYYRSIPELREYILIDQRRGVRQYAPTDIWHQE